MSHGSVATAPVLIDLDVALKVDLLVEETFQLATSFSGDTFESDALMADNDTFLRLALDVDDGFDADEFFLFFETYL